MSDPFGYLRDCPKDYVDFIERHAAASPEKTAIIFENGTLLSYAQLLKAINHMASTFYSAGIQQGDAVRIALADRAQTFIVMLALARLGCPSLTAADRTDQAIDVRASILPAGSLRVDSPIIVHFSPEWITKPDGGDKPPVSGFASPASVAHYTNSSGSTGIPKLVSCTLGRIHRMVLNGLEFDNGAAATSPCVITPNVNALWYLRQMLTILWTGGTLFIPASHVSRVPGYRYFGVRQIVCSSLQLSDVAEIAERNPALFSETQLVTTGGGKLSRDLADAVRKHVCPRIQINYGSTETGLIAAGYADVLDRNPDAVGLVLPSIDVETVDSDGRPVAEGMIRVRSATVAKDASRSDSDGRWFYTGDMGSLGDDRLLTVLGRAGEVINAGGVKVAYERVEELVRAYPGVADAAVAMAPNKFGVDRVFCAIVPRQPFDDTAFLNYLQSDSTLRKLAAALHGICKLPAIPKGDNGKVQRRALAEEINAGLEGSGRLGLWDNGNVLLQT